MWYDLTATIETLEVSERITYQINGNPPATINWNGQINSGGVGLTVRDGRVAFDDFVVEGDSIPNGGNGMPRSVSPAGLSTMTWADLKK